MRGTDEAIGSLFSYADLEARVPARHPLRKIRQVVNDALMENRSGLIVQGDLTQANGHAERRRTGNDPPPLPRLDPTADAGCRQGLRCR